MKRFFVDLNIHIECSVDQFPHVMCALGESLQCHVPCMSMDDTDGRCRIELHVLSELTIQPCS